MRQLLLLEFLIVLAAFPSYIITQEFNILTRTWFSLNRNLLWGFGNGYNGSQNINISARCATDTSQYQFLATSGSNFLGIFAFGYLNYPNISSDINENFWVGISHFPFKAQYIINPIQLYNQVADRFWVGIKQLRFKFNYINYAQVNQNISNYWGEIKSLISRCGGSNFTSDMDVFLNKSWVEAVVVYLYRFTLLLPLYFVYLGFSILKVLYFDFQGIGYLWGDYWKRMLTGSLYI